MYQPDSRMRRDINQYLKDMRERNLCEEYIGQSRDTLLRFQGHCASFGICASSRVTTEEIRSFMDKFQTLSGAYRRYIWAILRGFLTQTDNPAALKFKLRITGYSRQRVDWITPTETEGMLAMPMTAREAVMLRGGLLQGLRSCEILRLTRHDAEIALRDRVVQIHGKSGKMRSLPVHPGFAEAIKAYLDRNSGLAETDRLLGISRRTAYNTVVALSKRFGHRIATHSLRRSAGRNLWLRAVPIETIAEYYGHSSTDQSRKYIGINLSDMRAAIAEYGIKGEMKIIDETPQRRIAPQRPTDETVEENPPTMNQSTGTASLPPERPGTNSVTNLINEIDNLAT